MQSSYYLNLIIKLYLCNFILIYTIFILIEIISFSNFNKFTNLIFYLNAKTFFFSFFSEVFKARDKKNDCLVAMKKVLMEKEKEGVILSFVYILIHLLNIIKNILRSVISYLI